ncbi:MAG: ATP-dependent zinc metalloprotease FtsH [Candidatus Nomurabacteria bacterium]|nr:ATP-dependent zinc metalloprotease FtsH [Candidatus Nomurabacteria bacterium]
MSQKSKNPDKKQPLPKKPAQKTPSFFQSFLVVIAVLAAISLLYSFISEQKKPESISLSQVASDIQFGQISSIMVEGDKLILEYVDINPDTSEPIIKKSKKEREASLSETLVNYGVTPEQMSSIDIGVENESGFVFWLLQVLPILFPILFIVIFFWFIMRQMKGGGGMQAFSFGQSKAKITDPSKQKVTFADVAGAKEAKQELMEVVDFLKNPKKFLAIGAEIPKGVLLTGEPGTGKTLLARAVAGEAGVPFFHMSGSDFVEMFVGVGASRVRDLFETAKKMSPAIIFIDEIDAVGRSRGVGVGGGNDEREQTLNQILVEMDGFEPHEKLIIMAATNRADVLDKALLRPGRFDRQVIIDLPDREDREAILKIHARKKPLNEDVDLSVVAHRTPGFSGADLYSLMNEAAILTAREDRKTVTQWDVIRSIEKVMIGPERQSHLHTDQERKIVAYHEAGHAIVASVLPNADPVHKVSIVARGHAGGYTLKLPLEERKLTNRAQFMDDIAMSLGGYVAEKMIFGEVTTGPSSDLQVSSRLAHNMVTKWGMSDAIGPVALESDSQSPYVQQNDHVARLIAEEVKKIIDTSLKTAEDTLKKNREALESVVEGLLDKETLEQEDYDTIIRKHGIEPKKKPVKETKK